MAAGLVYITPKGSSSSCSSTKALDPKKERNGQKKKKDRWLIFLLSLSLFFLFFFSSGSLVSSFLTCSLRFFFFVFFFSLCAKRTGMFLRKNPSTLGLVPRKVGYYFFSACSLLFSWNDGRTLIEWQPLSALVVRSTIGCDLDGRDLMAHSYSSTFDNPHRLLPITNIKVSSWKRCKSRIFIRSVMRVYYFFTTESGKLVHDLSWN